jgi:hypothetical protein
VSILGETDTKMRLILSQLTLLMSVVLWVPVGATVSPFESVAVSGSTRAALEAEARPFGHGSVIARIEGGALFGDLEIAIVEFEDYQQTSDFTARFAVSCSLEDASWVCEHPYRIVTLLREIPLAEIELRGDVSITNVRRILRFMNRWVGVRLVAVTGIEVTGPGTYAVEVTYCDGFGTHTVMEKDLERAAE